jgi:hypothetical protein
VAISPYLDQREFRNTALRWAVATRTQLDRWEPLVAWYLRENMYGDDPHTGLLVWRARNEHHLALVAAAHLVKTVGHLAPPFQGLRQVVRDEITESRDLLEHWQENQPILNARPREAEPPKPSGKRYVTRNPKQSPYWSTAWDSKHGAMLSPHVPASEVRSLAQRVEAYAVQQDPALEQYVPEQVPLTLWVYDRGWWPLPRAERVVPAWLTDSGGIAT